MDFFTHFLISFSTSLNQVHYSGLLLCIYTVPSLSSISLFSVTVWLKVVGNVVLTDWVGFPSINMQEYDPLPVAHTMSSFAAPYMVPYHGSISCAGVICAVASESAFHVSQYILLFVGDEEDLQIWLPGQYSRYPLPCQSHHLFLPSLASLACSF